MGVLAGDKPASALIRIRVMPDTKARIQRAAALKGMTLSAYMLARADPAVGS